MMRVNFKSTNPFDDEDEDEVDDFKLVPDQKPQQSPNPYALPQDFTSKYVPRIPGSGQVINLKSFGEINLNLFESLIELQEKKNQANLAAPQRESAPDVTPPKENIQRSNSPDVNIRQDAISRTVTENASSPVQACQGCIQKSALETKAQFLSQKSIKLKKDINERDNSIKNLKELLQMKDEEIEEWKQKYERLEQNHKEELDKQRQDLQTQKSDIESGCNDDFDQKTKLSLLEVDLKQCMKDVSKLIRASISTTAEVDEYYDDVWSGMSKLKKNISKLTKSQKAAFDRQKELQSSLEYLKQQLKDKDEQIRSKSNGGVTAPFDTESVSQKKRFIYSEIREDKIEDDSPMRPRNNEVQKEYLKEQEQLLMNSTCYEYMTREELIIKNTMLKEEMARKVEDHENEIASLKEIIRMSEDK